VVVFLIDLPLPPHGTHRGGCEACLELALLGDQTLTQLNKLILIELARVILVNFLKESHDLLEIFASVVQTEA